MDKLDNFKKIIKKIIQHYVEEEYITTNNSTKFPVYDEERNHYFLMEVGWNNMRRIHYCLLHFEIKNHKIWIHKDFVEQGIATDLMENGISKNEIVLGFQAPSKRPYTEFAVT